MQNSDQFYLLARKLNGNFGVVAFVLLLRTVSADMTLSHYTQNLVDTLLCSRVASLTNLNLYHICEANNSKNNCTRLFLTTMKRILIRLAR